MQTAMLRSSSPPRRSTAAAAAAALASSVALSTAAPSSSSDKLARFPHRTHSSPDTAAAAADELQDGLHKDARRMYADEIELYKRRVTYAIVLAVIGIVMAIGMLAWTLSRNEASYDELRIKLLSTPREPARLCVTLYPNSIKKKFDPDIVGAPLFLTPYVDSGTDTDLKEAAHKALVKDIFQGEHSFAGFLTVNKSHSSNLFFWFFTAQTKAAEAPILLWLQGGPGWPTMYSLFKENGPFLVGWDDEKEKPLLLKNRHTWTANHNMLYIDNPVGTGFSFTDNDAGYPTTDQELAADLLEAVRQFMILFPAFVPDANPAMTPFYAFGESYGGAYVVSLAHLYLESRENSPDYVKNIHFKGIGIGNGFISAIHQSQYADYVRTLTYATEEQMEQLRAHDQSLVKALQNHNYSQALDFSQKSLHYFVSEIMNLTNIYDYTFDENYLTNHEYICFLQQDHVRRSIHVGNLTFNKGFVAYNQLNQTIMVSKQEWLEQALERGIDVLIYNGNLDFIVNVPGMNRLLEALQWSGKGEFRKSLRKDFWVWNKYTQRGELAGYVNQGGGLTFVLMRNAGHMVPISQPLRAKELVTRFTHAAGAQDPFSLPEQLQKPVDNKGSFYHCN